MKKKYKPGPGWCNPTRTVYVKNGFAIGLFSLALVFPNQKGIRLNPDQWPLLNFIQANGGNVKRGMMAFVNFYYILG